MRLTFKWNPQALSSRRKKLEKAQEYVDKECLARMTPYVPVARKDRYKNAGKLAASGKVSSPGKIEYTAPFAKSDYYAAKDHSHSGNPNGKRLWFEVMKAKDAADIMEEAAKIVGGKAKK